MCPRISIKEEKEQRIHTGLEKSGIWTICHKWGRISVRGLHYHLIRVHFPKWDQRAKGEEQERKKSKERV